MSSQFACSPEDRETASQPPIFRATLNPPDGRDQSGEAFRRFSCPQPQFSLYRNSAKFVSEGFQDIKHLSFALIHVSPIQAALNFRTRRVAVCRIALHQLTVASVDIAFEIAAHRYFVRRSPGHSTKAVKGRGGICDPKIDARTTL